MAPYPVLVALYPLSSPNHNCVLTCFPYFLLRYILFHHQTTTLTQANQLNRPLRYILFHHQTTTPCWVKGKRVRCVISSFITKPQRAQRGLADVNVALYPLSSPNHNMFHKVLRSSPVALYPLSSPNHNMRGLDLANPDVALYPLSSPNHN